MGKTLFLITTATLAVAAVTDIRSRKIPNLLTFPALLAGLLMNTWAGGLHGLLYSIEGTLVGLGLLIIPYVLGGMGAGDVKLMAAVGSLVGPIGALNAFLATSIVGGTMALLVLLSRGTLKKIGCGFASGMGISALKSASAESRNKAGLSYGVAIAIGTIISISKPFI